MISFQNVSKVYNSRSVALENINFSIQPNEFVSIVGRNGAGKSTIIKLLIGEEKPSKGRIFFGGQEVNKLKPHELSGLRRRIGIVFQDFRLLPNKNAYENIAFAMEAAGRTDEEIASDVPHVLDLVGLSHKMRSFPHELSGGERQRIGIARAIVNQPDVILADEPTGNLDHLNTHEIIKILKKINDLGTTVIMTTHNKGVIDSLGRRVVTMEEGRIVRDDPTGRYVL